MSISNIDDLLLGGKTSTHPETPENGYQDGPEEIEENEIETPDYNASEETVDTDSNDDQENDENQTDAKVLKDVDDYGNEAPLENEAIRERLSRQAKKYEAEIDSLRSQLANQGASREVQQAAKDFEYDPDAKGDWQQQLASFVKQTVNSMSREQEETKYRQEEARVQTEFESKFSRSMNKFDDFKDVMMGLPFEITNPMTLATRAMDDPAAFLYAAAKRQPKELERISKLRDPYAQMTEIGKLEERMRRNKSTTNAPRPLGRTQDDAPSKEVKKSKEPSIEDLIRQSESKKLSKMRGRAARR